MLRLASREVCSVTKFPSPHQFGRRQTNGDVIRNLTNLGKRFRSHPLYPFCFFQNKERKNKTKSTRPLTAMPGTFIQQAPQIAITDTPNLVDDVMVLRGPFCHSKFGSERSHLQMQDENADCKALRSAKKRTLESHDLTDTNSSKAMKPAFPTTFDMIQEALLGNLVGPYVADRSTFNNFASASRELHEVCKLLPAPWPRQKLSVDAVAQSLSFSPCGEMLACCAGERIHIWHRQTGYEQLIRTSGQVTCVSFSPCGKYLASGHRSQTSSEYDFILRENLEVSVVRLWDSKTLECVRVLQGDNFGGMFTVDFSPDGQYIAAGGADQLIRLWNVKDGICRHTLQGHSGWIYCLRFSPDGKYLASAGEDETSVLLWDLSTFQVLYLEGHAESVHCVAFTRDGNYLVSGSDDETIRVWDLFNNFACSLLENNLCSVWALACSPDSKNIVSGSRDDDGNQVIRVWNIRQHKSVSVLQGHHEFITSLAFSPSGRTLASGSFDCSVRTWNLATEDAVRNIGTQDHERREKFVQ